VRVEVLDRLAAPYGLVRYGVAPDHVWMKSVVRVLHEPLLSGAARLIGNVQVGQGVEGITIPIMPRFSLSREISVGAGQLSVAARFVGLTIRVHRRL
jgi:hypothetical protein